MYFKQQEQLMVLIHKYYRSENFQLYSKNKFLGTLNFEGQAAIGSYLMIMNSNIRLLGSSKVSYENSL